MAGYELCEHAFSADHFGGTVSSKYATEQEAFWNGEFGREYIYRNQLTPDMLASRLALWAGILRHCRLKLSSILELGANVGINLHALRLLNPHALMTGVEINPEAAELLRQWGQAQVVEASLFDFKPEQRWDLVFTSGVLIHLHPDKLPEAYDLMATASARFVCMVEYYNPSPVSIPYRNNHEKLFQRDFAGEFLAAHSSYRLRDYGFVYRHDSVFPADDLSWFLMERY